MHQIALEIMLLLNLLEKASQKVRETKFWQLAHTICNLYGLTTLQWCYRKNALIFSQLEACNFIMRVIIFHVILSCLLLYLKLSKFSFLFSDFTVYVHNLYFFDSSTIFSWFAWSSCLFKVPQINRNQVWTGYWEDYRGTHCYSVSFLVLHFKTIT